MTQNNPFFTITVRNLIFWLIIGSVILGLFSESLRILGTYILQSNFLALKEINFKEPIFSFIIANFSFYLLIVSWLLFQRKRSQLKFKFVFGNLPHSRCWLPYLLLVIPLVLFSLGSSVIGYYLVSLVSPEMVTSIIEKKLFLTQEETTFPVIYNLLQVVFMVVFAPVVEEILFRGFVLQRWSVKWGIVPGVITSSLIFGLLHFNSLGLFNFGLVMAILYLRTNTLFVPIILHALNNFIAVGVEFSLFRLSEKTTIYTLEQIQSSWWLGLIAIALSLPWLFLFWRNNLHFFHQALPYFVNRDFASLHQPS